MDPHRLNEKQKPVARKLDETVGVVVFGLLALITTFLVLGASLRYFLPEKQVIRLEKTKWDDCSCCICNECICPK